MPLAVATGQSQPLYIKLCKRTGWEHQMLYLILTIWITLHFLSFNLLSALTTAWQFCSLHEVSLDVKPLTKFANDLTFEV